MPDEPITDTPNPTPAVATVPAPVVPGGGAPAGFVPQADLERVEAARRDLQSQVDKLKAAATPAPAVAPAATGDADRIAALEAQIKAFDPATIATQLQAGLAKAQLLVDSRTALAAKFGNARPEILAARYETPEEMAVAVEASHTTETAAIAAVEERVRGEYAAQMKALHGIDLAPPPQAPAPGSIKDADAPPSSITELAALSTEDILGMDDEAIQKALARVS